MTRLLVIFNLHLMAIKNGNSDAIFQAFLLSYLHYTRKKKDITLVPCHFTQT